MSEKILPDVIIIGAMKAGTTSLYEYMAGHPQIGVSTEKETDFFIDGKNWSRGLDWYCGQFRDGYQVYVEASPNYTKRDVFKDVPERIAEVIPACKFIFLARDPVKRAESQYRHAALAGIDVPDMADLPGSRTLRHITETSRYAAQLDPYLARFPHENFLLLQFEDLIRDPGPVLSDVASFLGVRDNWPAADSVATNSAQSLARLPHWVFALRETRFASFVKRGLSRGAVDRLKALVSRGRTPRQVERFPDEIREMIAAEVHEDQERFRKMMAQSSAIRPPSALAQIS